MTNSTQNRLHEFDFLRSVAIIGVLIIHSALIYATTDSEYFIGDWFATFSRPCIGIFLFISGYLLAHRTFDISQLKRRLKRVWLPYAFFSLFAYGYKIFFFAYADNTSFLTQIIDLFPKIIASFPIGHTLGIYYFVFIITVSYLILYLMRRTHTPTIAVLLPFALLILIHNAYYTPLINNLQIESDTPFRTLYTYRYLFWPFYFLLGIFANEQGLLASCKQHRKKIIGLWLAVFILYNILYIAQIGNVDGFDSIIGTLYTLITIAFLLTFTFDSPRLRYISGISYYLYLSHIFVVYFFVSLGLVLNRTIPFWFAALSFMFSLILPILAYELQRKVFGNKLTPILGA